MSIAYKKRKKAIRDEKRRRGPKGLLHGQIPEMDFAMLQANWQREIDGPPLCSLADMVPMQKGGVIG